MASQEDLVTGAAPTPAAVFLVGITVSCEETRECDSVALRTRVARGNEMGFPVEGLRKVVFFEGSAPSETL